MDHRDYGAKLSRARELRAWGFAPSRIAGMLDVSRTWVRKHTDPVARPAGQPRKFDHDKAMRLLEQGMSGYKVAKRMRVHKNTIYSMRKRRQQ